MLRAIIINLSFALFLSLTIPMNVSGNSPQQLSEESIDQIHPQIFNRLMKSANEHISLSVGRCYQAYRAGELTIEPKFESGILYGYDLRYRECAWLELLEDL